MMERRSAYRVLVGKLEGKRPLEDSGVDTHTHTYIHTQVYIHTYIHAQTHTHTHTKIPSS